MFKGHIRVILAALAVIVYGEDVEDVIEHVDIDDTTVSAGIEHSCAIHSVSAADFGGKVICWGSNSMGQAEAPDAEFIQVSSGRFHSCGVKLDETIECWGDPNHAMTPEGLFVQVSCGDFHTCGVLKDSSLSCWGANYDNQLEFPTGKFVQVSCGKFNNLMGHSCALSIDGSVHCWGADRYGQSTAPKDVKFLQVSAAPGDFSCGITVNNEIRCWGDNHRKQREPPNGTFSLVSTSRLSACGINVIFISKSIQELIIKEKFVHCWGMKEGVTAVPNHVKFDELTLGWDHGCGIASDTGKVVCWGSDSDGRLDIPIKLR
uniref:non-specific serine/threonine protein kinase n=1 Tax=Thraustotheca clavata TaxID=74557 RepID=A0A0A7CLC4_9STRA|nr:secreted protein [Thraustotheca clavata]